MTPLYVPPSSTSCPRPESSAIVAVVVPHADADVVDPRPVLGEETRVHAVPLERLDELPLDVADLRQREPPGVLDRPAALVHALRRSPG